MVYALSSGITDVLENCSLEDDTILQTLRL